MTFKILKKSFYINLFILALIFAIDRITKTYVIYLDKQNLGSEIFTSTFLNITLIWNSGIAFGLFSFDKIYFYNLLSIIIALVILMLIVMAIKNLGSKRYFLLMIIGGALGNFYDRIFYKAVPDFLDFHVEDYHWFIFNFADIFISIGVILMILYEIIDNNRSNTNDKY